VTDPGTQAGWTQADTDGLFTSLGKYVVIFQWIEGVLDEILLLAWGHENWASSQTRLAKMTNEEKVNAVKTVVFTSPDFARVHTRPDWLLKFEGVMERLHRERMKRNAIVHSQYLLQFADAGLVPLSSARRRLEGNTVFTQQELSKEFQAKLLDDLAQLALDLNFVRVQLVHDYRAPIRPVPL
jgi:hypothetical protein